MMASTEPTVLLSYLDSADGSATFSQNNYTVIGVVNGPIEIQRRDELPEEAVIDVIVRPAAGVGGTRERHLEAILESTLRQVILINHFPRNLIQITLQITNTPEDDTAGNKLVQAGSNLPILPALLQTAALTLLSASLPLALTFSSVLLCFDTATKKIITHPSIQEYQSADSAHVLAFTSDDKLLVAESEGTFTIEEWEQIYEQGRSICCSDKLDRNTMQDGLHGEMMHFVESALRDKVAEDLHWKV